MVRLVRLRLDADIVALRHDADAARAHAAQVAALWLTAEQAQARADHSHDPADQQAAEQAWKAHALAAWPEWAIRQHIARDERRATRRED